MLTIVNDDPLLMIVNLFINEKKFKNDSFFKQSYKKTIADRFIKTIVIHFLKVQNETIKNVITPLRINLISFRYPVLVIPCKNNFNLEDQTQFKIVPNLHIILDIDINRLRLTLLSIVT